MSQTRQIPIFPLPNVVHFPRTDLRLHIFEPRYRALIRDLEQLDESDRLIGMVLTHSGEEDLGGSPPVYESGTAGLVRDIDYLTDGRSNILIEGQFRFRIEAELDPEPYRRALVAPLLETALHYADDRARCYEILDLVHYLEASSPSMPTVEDDSDGLNLEALVNGLAAHLDLPVLAKLDLLNRDLDDRSSRVVDILHARKRVVDLLTPFRGIQADPDLS
ncbi:MAG: LON peptidase substrate-binding domain-containing protein [Acidobacteriota bacterium]|nr:LON peptidase substrate-binding domain-containing protein [Acidobacteriota bacterium]